MGAATALATGFSTGWATLGAGLVMDLTGAAPEALADFAAAVVSFEIGVETFLADAAVFATPAATGLRATTLGVAAFLAAGLTTLAAGFAAALDTGLALGAGFCTLAGALGFLGCAFISCLLTVLASACACCMPPGPASPGDLWSSITCVIPLLLTFEGLFCGLSPARDCIG
ncbi:MAG: hypothetical protein P4L96_02560 [Rhodoferax sp.]|nr:hypothetical protein [Rhodoferax sp.]